MITAALIVAGTCIAYALLVLAKPLVRCPGCLGRRVRRSGTGRQVRISKCRFCRASGIYRMPLATTVHRFFWSVAGEHIREGARASVAGQISTREDKTS